MYFFFRLANFLSNVHKHINLIDIQSTFFSLYSLTRDVYVRVEREKESDNIMSAGGQEKIKEVR
jgi:hypothetical protein